MWALRQPDLSPRRLGRPADAPSCPPEGLSGHVRAQHCRGRLACARLGGNTGRPLRRSANTRCRHMAQLGRAASKWKQPRPSNALPLVQAFALCLLALVACAAAADGGYYYGGARRLSEASGFGRSLLSTVSAGACRPAAPPALACRPPLPFPRNTAAKCTECTWCEARAVPRPPPAATGLSDLPNVPPRRARCSFPPPAPPPVPAAHPAHPVLDPS